MSLFVPQDEDAFFKDYAESHKKLSELGFTPRSTASAKSDLPTGAVLAQSAFGVAVAAAVVIAGYLYVDKAARVLYTWSTGRMMQTEREGYAADNTN